MFILFLSVTRTVNIRVLRLHVERCIISGIKGWQGVLIGVDLLRRGGAWCSFLCSNVCRRLWARLVIAHRRISVGGCITLWDI